MWRKYKYLLLLIIIAIISAILFLAQPVLEEYGGKIGFIFGKIHLLIAPVLFFGWMIMVNDRITYRQAFYPILFISYLGFTFLWLLIIDAHFIRDAYAIRKQATEDVILDYGFLVLFPFLTTLWNYILARIEKRKLSKKDLPFLFISTFLIPIATFAIYLILVYTIKRMTLLAQHDLYTSVMNGSLFAAVMCTYILYEGSYFLWLKEKINF